VIGVQIGGEDPFLQPVLGDDEGIVVALSARLHRLVDPRHPGVGIGRGKDEVLPVAIRARGAVTDAGLEGTTVDGSVVLELDVRVALAAGSRHVDGVDPGLGIRRTLYPVNPVAVRAGGGGGDPPGGSLAVDGKGVLLERVGETDVLVRQEARLSVALGAGSR
jgi:hypothetical protein